MIGKVDEMKNGTPPHASLPFWIASQYMGLIGHRLIQGHATAAWDSDSNPSHASVSNWRWKCAIPAPATLIFRRIWLHCGRRHSRTRAS